MSEPSEKSGPDLARGVDVEMLEDGVPLLGHVGEEAVMLVRRGTEIFAIGATCTHYGGPLAEGLVVGDTVRCPWHHACFSLRTGEAERPPALNPVACFKVERQGSKVSVGDKLEPPAKPDAVTSVKKIVIVGGGAAGQIAAETLRHEGFSGSITMLSADSAVPCDRPNLSKDYLAGNAEEDWIPLRPAEFYDEKKIELRLDTRVVAIHAKEKEVELADGSRRRLRRAPPGDRRRARAARRAGRGPAARPLSAHARRQQRHHRGGQRAKRERS